MALTKSIIPAVLAVGLETGTEPKLVSKGLLRLENARFTRTGAISKRPGVDTCSGTYVDGYMTTFENKPVLYNKQFYIHDSISNAFEPVDDIPVIDCEFTKVQALGETVVLQQDMAEYGNIRAVVWLGSDEGGLSHYVSTYAINTGLLLDQAELGNTFVLGMIRVVATSTNLLYYVVGDTYDIRRGSINVSTGEIGAHTVVDTEIPIVKATPLSRNFDACAVPDTGGNDWVMLSFIGGEGVHDGYAIAASTDKAGTYDSYQTAGCIRGVDGQVANCFDLANNEGVIVYYDAGVQDISMRGYTSSSLTPSLNELVLRTWADANVYPAWMSGICTEGDGVAGAIYMNIDDDNKTYPEWYRYIRKAVFTRSGSTATLTGEGEWAEGIVAVTKPIGLDQEGYHYLIAEPAMALGDQPLATNFIIRNDFFVVGKLMEGIAFSTAPVGHKEVVSGTTWRTVLTTYYADDTQGMALVTVSTELANKDRTADETLQHLAFSGSIPSQWDGQEITEQGFLAYPHRIDCTAGVPATTSNLDAPSTYGYCATYEWYDNKGNRHQSAPSLVDSVITNTGNNEVTVIVPTCTLTEKGSTDIQVVLWRTEGYGSIYYRADVQYNPQYASSVTFTDTLADSSLLSREAIYTTGGILENVAPPASRVSCIHQNRLFYVNRHNENIEIRYSKEFRDREGISHSDVLVIYCPHEGGKITAIRSFLDRLIIFKKDRIYSTYGTGLTDLGTGNGYADPTMLYPSLGCPNQKTIVETPVGLIFQASDNRFYVLDRSLKVTAIGQGVEYWSKNQTITCSYEEANNNEAVWLVEDGYAMVYNWEHGLWATWSNHGALDCTVADEVPYWLTTSLEVNYHASDYLEGDESAHTIVETGWFSFNQLEGFARLKRILILGTMASEHILTVKIAYDFDPYWTDVFEYDADSYLEIFGYEQYFGECADSTYEDQAYMLEVSGSRQKCTAVRIQIYDAGVREEGFELTGIAFEVAGKKGPIRLGADRIKA